MNARASFAVAVASIGACLSYTTMRLIDRVGEPPMGAVLLQAHVPYYWRVGAALLHALILGLSLYTLLSEARAARGLAALPRWAWILVLPAALAMGLFP
ncbi:MAG: hypothetical protein H6740_08735 [Alphaproteobacteria bacterium]|nr:hypothetical protein [Alphaproteobacteria bacterium]